MGLLDGVLGGIVGAGVNQLIERNGGIQGLVNQFEQKGLGGTARSWVATGPNQGVSAAQLLEVLGARNVAEFASKLNVSQQDLLEKLYRLKRRSLSSPTALLIRGPERISAYGRMIDAPKYAGGTLSVRADRD